MKSPEQAATDCRDREKDLWSAIEDYRAGSLEHPVVQQYIDMFASAERVDEAVSRAAEIRRLRDQIDLRDAELMRLTTEVHGLASQKPGGVGRALRAILAAGPWKP